MNCLNQLNLVGCAHPTRKNVCNVGVNGSESKDKYNKVELILENFGYINQSGRYGFPRADGTIPEKKASRNLMRLLPSAHSKTDSFWAKDMMTKVNIISKSLLSGNVFNPTLIHHFRLTAALKRHFEILQPVDQQGLLGKGNSRGIGIRYRFFERERS